MKTIAKNTLSGLCWVIMLISTIALLSEVIESAKDHVTRRKAKKANKA